MLSDHERSRKIAHVLTECPDIFSDFQIVQTILALHYTVSGPDGIGYPYLEAAIDEARSGRMLFMGTVNLTFSTASTEARIS